ncbi:MAG: AAA family ATPase, partial [Longimicrobiales bacterium]
MNFTGRSQELGLLRTELDKQEARCVSVFGLPGAGTSALVRRAVERYPGLRFRCPPRPDPLIRLDLWRRMQGQPSDDDRPGHPSRPSAVDVDRKGRVPDSEIPSWSRLFRELLSHATNRGPFVLILDDAHRMQDARSRFEAGLAEALTAARASRVPFHVVLAGRAGSMPSVGPDFEVATPSLVLQVDPLPLRAAAPHLPGTHPSDKIRAYGVFGGLPGVLAHLDTSVTVGTNVRRLLLQDQGPLAELPMTWLERSVQTVTRYVALLEALSVGEAEWADLSGAIPDLTKSGQVAPYLKRLAELGLIRSRRSLDAAPRSRSSRYALTDPFLAFWLRFILPWRISERGSEIVPHYADKIRPRIRDHLQRMMPMVCRRHMEIDALETLGSNARDSGSIWGPASEIPVAGTLGSGAIYYGVCLWDPPATRPH